MSPRIRPRPPPPRTEPYERTPPPPKEHHYRKAWVGSTSIYDAKGNELHTWRYAAEADVDPTELANRVAKDVAWILKAHPGIPVHCVQDAAPELDRLPQALVSVLPTRDQDRIRLVLMDILESGLQSCRSKGKLLASMNNSDCGSVHCACRLKEEARFLPDRFGAADPHVRPMAEAPPFAYSSEFKTPLSFAITDRSLRSGPGGYPHCCTRFRSREPAVTSRRLHRGVGSIPVRIEGFRGEPSA